MAETPGPEEPASPATGGAPTRGASVAVKALARSPWARIALVLSVIGPGIITANVDNDAGGIATYSQAGADFGYSLLWTLIPITFGLILVQEMCARMAVVTGKGLADLIREEYGVKVTFFAMAVLLIANYTTTVSEFAGITAAVQIFAPGAAHHLASSVLMPVFGHVPAWLLTDEGAQRAARWTVVPLVGVGVWLLVTRGSYRRVERILLAASLVYLSYIISAFRSHPHWGSVLRQTIVPDMHAIHVDKLYLLAVIQIIGTTITPWGQFYIQSSVRDKGDKVEDYPHRRIDVLFGAFFTNFIAFFIIVCCGATLFHALGVSAETRLGADGFTRPVSVGQPVMELFG